MMKLLGVLLVWGGCGLCGVQACVALGRRIRCLEEIGRGLEIMERELALNATALPELLAQLSDAEGNLFFLCKTALEKGKYFPDAWTEALENSRLTLRDRQLLSGLSRLLGRYDAQGQVHALARLQADWSRHVESVRRQGERMRTVYGVLGMAAGGFLSLLLV